MLGERSGRIKPGPLAGLPIGRNEFAVRRSRVWLPKNEIERLVGRIFVLGRRNMKIIRDTSEHRLLEDDPRSGSSVRRFGGLRLRRDGYCGAEEKERSGPTRGSHRCGLFQS